MTVSRVVRECPNVKASTKARVRRAIDELGYRPDPALSALAAYRNRENGQQDGSIMAFLDCDGTTYS